MDQPPTDPPLSTSHRRCFVNTMKNLVIEPRISGKIPNEFEKLLQLETLKLGLNDFHSLLA
ncbi:hypothetical protein JHK84_050098 [Glycine max]|nr:hypothetical protein JHK85_050825 [Glycine max]KAG5094510.1 hypothetical protein JHK84_050098 [Glycine max]